MNELEEIEQKIKKLLDKKTELLTREEKELAELKKQKADEKKKKKKDADDTDIEPPELPERDKDGKFKKKDGATPTDIKELTAVITEMGKEIQELKKGKITRKKPSEAKKTQEEDLPESVTIKIQKNMFEVDV